jgi:hypothetical protein
MRGWIFGLGTAAVAVMVGLACADRPNFAQDEIGDACYVAEDCGTLAYPNGDTGWSELSISLGDYALAPIEFAAYYYEDDPWLACREKQCCLADDSYNPVDQRYYATGSSYGTEPWNDGTVYLYCERTEDCCPGSDCLGIVSTIEYDGSVLSRDVRRTCRESCENDSDCPSARCAGGFCLDETESILAP